MGKKSKGARATSAAAARPRCLHGAPPVDNDPAQYARQQSAETLVELCVMRVNMDHTTFKMSDTMCTVLEDMLRTAEAIPDADYLKHIVAFGVTKALDPRR